MMQHLKIALVEYYNTYPFLEALENSPNFQGAQLIKANPGVCASMFENDEVSIALIPSFAFFNAGKGKIISNYCIGSDGAVRTVCLMANEDVKQLNRIYLDEQSRTSVHLLKILCKEHWNIQPEFITSKVEGLVLEKNEGKLMIGDKVFFEEFDFKVNYDLAEVWKEHTGLPFVFAVWVMKDGIDVHIERDINKAFDKSFQDIQSVIKRHKLLNQKFDLEEYYSKHISFNLDDAKRKGLILFRLKCQEHFQLDEALL